MEALASTGGAFATPRTQLPMAGTATGYSSATTGTGTSNAAGSTTFLAASLAALGHEPAASLRPRTAASGIPASAGAAAAPQADATAGATTVTRPLAGTQSVLQIAPIDPPAPQPTPPAAPLSFVWNDRWFRQVAPPKDIDIDDREVVDDRAMRAVLKHLMEEEQIEDFAVDSITARRASAGTEPDLLRMNPSSYWVFDVVGRDGDGKQRTVPAVMNRDGRTYVDPKIRF